MSPNHFKIPAQDGYAVSVTEFSSDEDAKPVVIVAPAMGAGQSFYHPLAQWIAGQGFRVFCFDYRGLEKGTKVGPEMQHSILTWARFDANAVLEHGYDSARGESVIWFGHSLGCQLLGAIPARDKIDRVIGVATGTGYMWRGDWALLPKALLLWFVLVPGLTPLFGYFPGKRLNVVTDLPREVIWQWRRWCLNRDYVAGAEGSALKKNYDALTFPLDILTFSDDELMSRGNSDDLYRLYPKARGTHHRIEPAQAGLKRIGHFGFFKSRHASSLWPLMAEKLLNKTKKPEET